MLVKQIYNSNIERFTALYCAITVPLTSVQCNFTFVVGLTAQCNTVQCGEEKKKITFIMPTLC